MKIGLVIPAYRANKHINLVIRDFIDLVDKILVVEDCCPQQTHKDIDAAHKENPKVDVIVNNQNLGVGGATKIGYKYYADKDIDIVVKVDSDGQMSPMYLNDLTRPIRDGVAHYTKGNRFHSYKSISKMPPIRIFGNSVLTLINKLSSGYWKIDDPCNGYTALKRDVISNLPLDKISNRYFFESDMLHYLYLDEKVVKDVRMDALYADEVSHLSIRKAIPEFLFKHAINLFRRLWFKYYAEGVGLASMLLLGSFILSLCSTLYLLSNYFASASQHSTTPFGTISLGMLGFSLGILLGIIFIIFDFNNEPKV